MGGGRDWWGTDDTSHTIGWAISHYAALNPTFTVTVKIYDLQGNLVTTFQ